MRFGVLGPLVVWTSGGTPVRVPGAKVRTLLCVLLTREGDPVSAERLMEDLWGGRAPNDATGSLQAMISRLRRVLADAEPGGRDLVERGPAGYRLVAEKADLDTTRAEVLLTRARTLELPCARAETLREALGLWRGQAYAEVAQEPFARATAARWEERRLTAVEDLAETRLALGEHRVLVGELGDLVDRHPRRERMRGAYMLALYRSGRQSEALESFEQLRVHLAEELGLDPGPEQEAHARLECAQAMLGSGDVAVIEELSSAALSVFRDAGDRWGIAAALAVQAEVALVGGDLERARTDAATARTLFAEFGDRHGDLISAATLGTLAEIHGDHTAARRLNEEALRVAEELGLWVAVSERLASLGRLHLLEEDFDAAADLHREALRIARERAHGSGAAFAETGLALADRRRGELDSAQQRMERLLASNSAAGYLPGVALALTELGFVAELRADVDSAHAMHTEGLAVARRTGDRRAVALALEGLAGVSVLTGDHRHAAELLGQAAALRDAVGAPLPSAERGDVNRIIAQVRQVLTAEEFAAAHAQGADAPPPQ